MATSKPTSTRDYICKINDAVQHMNNLLGHGIVDLNDLLKKKNSTDEIQAILNIDDIGFRGEKNKLKNQLDEFANIYEQLRSTIIRNKKGRNGEEQEDSGYISKDSNLLESDGIPCSNGGIQDATPHDTSQVRRARILTRSDFEHIDIAFNKDS
ncbi:uncharacterized protein LOC127726067 [Mytilus californianus]|uniref:uncharacterized protein LOC127726067 n=1 Tax=Mytilus californianus TaxID=6549 RepID=UPI00224746E1|nr:uncharacterized protein LOC127726067 [Mytilus californianus]